MPKLSLICPICSNVYLTDLGRLKHGRGKTCSYACGRALMGKPIQEKILINCANCGKNLLKPRKIVEQATNNYCSRQCMSNRTTVNCANCGNLIDKPASANPTYCSKKCADTSATKSQKSSISTKDAWQDPIKRKNMEDGIARRSLSEEWRSSPHFQTGEKHPRYKGRIKSRTVRYEVKQWRMSVFKRDSFTCQHCGANKCRLNAHHLKGWAEFPQLRLDVDNGITLCEPCHTAIHGLSPKHFQINCKECGQKKLDRRSKLCRKCWFENRRKNSRN